MPEKMKEIEGIIAGLDKQIQQVLIEAKILEVTLSPNFDMGINWQALINRAARDAFNVSMVFPADSDVTEGARIVAGTIGIEDYNATFQLLKTVGETKILSSPRITVANNREATIMVGKKEAYVTSSTTQGTSTATTSDSVSFIDVGISLYVTPVINPDGFVIMKIRPEVSNVESYLTTYNADNETIRTKVPIVATANAETTVIAKDGTTIIIGGLIKNDVLRTTKSVPFLGDIPLLGTLFRSVHEEKEKKEMVVFLTPTIISGDVDMPDWENKDIKDLRGYSDGAP
jgi:MSHA biogenesis protein MshL